MRYTVSIITLIVVVASAYFFVMDARSGFIVDQYKPAPPKKAKKAAHATLIPIAGQKSLYKVSFTEKSAERVGIKTAPMREERVTRKRMLTGTVEASSEGSLQLSVPLSGRTDEPAAGQSVSLRRVGADAIVAKAQLQDVTRMAGEDGQRIARLKIDGSPGPLVAGDRVQVDMTLGEPGDRKLIPSAAVVFDAKGAAWVYVAVEPLTFVRTAVKVDYVDAEVAHLREGPKAGTPVAVGGVVEISGTESRIGFVSMSASF
jgi:hypothetical protein